jgi:hypothetical protein
MPSRKRRPSRLTALITAVAAAAAFLGLTPAERVGAATRDNVVLQWNAAMLQAVRDSQLGPPIVARALAIVHTCMYDAWAAYDRVAVGTRYGGALRRPPGERSLTNHVEAISFAAYRAAVDLFPGSRTTVFDPLMARLGYDAADAPTDRASPSGLGNVACGAVLSFRHSDGSNQLGDEPGATPGVPYSDYTGYRPANDPMDLTKPFDSSTVHDPSRWQPLRYPDARGALVTPAFIAPHWGRVIPFALPSDASLRSPSGPALHGTAEYRRQALDLLDMSAHLTDEQKVIAEYWADGPSSELPPGHWNLFAQYVSRRDHHGNGRRGIDADIKMFFALNNALFDSGIVAWDNKRAYDSARPITAIRYLFNGQQVRAWAGPYQGTKLIDGGAWRPYQTPTFPTPPFAEYASGHSNFSAAGAGILRLFTGSDRFGLSAVVPAGSSRVEPGAVPARDMTLRWATFTEAANEAGLSRRYGGIHFEQGDLDARATGRACAEMTWEFVQRYFTGTAGRN